MSIQDEEQDRKPEEDSGRRRRQRRTSTGRTTTRKSSPKPPAVVNPGWIHKAVADTLLRGMQGRFQTETGQPFDVGSLEAVETELEELTGGKEPVDILARILAHAGHRIPGVKKVEKQLEGRDKSSGVGSDILAFLSVIYLRNREVFNEASRAMRERAASRGVEIVDPRDNGAVHVEPEIRVPA